MKQSKIKFDLPNCHPGPVWLESNHNNKKRKLRTHGKNATELGRRATSPKQAMAARGVAHRSGPRLELGEIYADFGQHVLD
ncbi:MAG: hypothetical protein ABWZ93_01680, partial [Xanthobacteraceae bacterium]